jgi:hypothetical protein
MSVNLGAVFLPLGVTPTPCFVHDVTKVNKLHLNDDKCVCVWGGYRLGSVSWNMLVRPNLSKETSNQFDFVLHLTVMLSLWLVKSPPLSPCAVLCYVWLLFTSDEKLIYHIEAEISTDRYLHKKINSTKLRFRSSRFALTSLLKNCACFIHCHLCRETRCLVSSGGKK